MQHNEEQLINDAAQRAEQRQMVQNDNALEPWQVMQQITQRIEKAFEPRVPTNPATYEAKKEAL